MRRLALAASLCLAAGTASAGAERPPKPEASVSRICSLIAHHADLNMLPRAWFARLIWKESRFDPEGVSPVGAEGIAQFMPGTAKLRGLQDSFDIEQAIPASAEYLSELKQRFGNLGLAAAAYNSGENRVSRWLNQGGFLPLETENYVLDIMGEPVDSFIDRGHTGTIPPLDKKQPFGRACRELPVTLAGTIPMARVHVKPWGIQLAGNFRRAAAIRQYERVKRRFPQLLRDYDPVVSRVRSAGRGRRGIYAVRIGADSRADADIVCQKLRAVGGSCVVLKNR